MLTPADIEQKTFSTALRGYDLDEVDDFLDEVMTTIRNLQEELAEARSAVARAPEAGADESAVGRVLIAAQSAADQILDQAREEADRLLAEAKEEAEALLSDARDEAEDFVAQRDTKRAEVEAEMETLSQRISDIRTQLAVLATAVADKLDEMDALIDSGGPESEVEAEADLEPDGFDEAGEDEPGSPDWDEPATDDDAEDDDTEDDDTEDDDTEGGGLF